MLGILADHLTEIGDAAAGDATRAILNVKATALKICNMGRVAKGDSEDESACRVCVMLTRLFLTGKRHEYLADFPPQDFKERRDNLERLIRAAALGEGSGARG